MLDSVLETIKKHGMLSLNDRVIVGVSGGPDSIALLHALYTIKDDYNMEVYAAHLNHMLRGEEADKDTSYVEDFCSRLGVPCMVKFVDINKLSEKEGLSHEEAGRKARYDFFLETAKEVGANKIALAHNMNDQAETILMRIIRGTGLEGLCGIKPVREGLFIRPLLFTPRRDIEEYCKKHGLEPRIDSTNLEPIYFRNKIRLELIPYIKENYSSNIEHSLIAMAELLREDNDFLEIETDSAYRGMVSERVDGVSIDLAELNNLHNSMRKRVIRKSIHKVKGDLNGIESKHIELIISITENGKTGAAVDLPGSIRACISYNDLNIIKLSGETNIIFEYELSIPGTTYVHETGGFVKAEVLEENFPYNSKGEKFVKYFDYDKIKYTLTLRTRRQGDYIVPIGMRGKKKIKDLFIDEKIPREERGRIPLISMGSEILWVIGYKVSDNYKITDGTKKTLRLEYKNHGGNINAK